MLQKPLTPKQKEESENHRSKSFSICQKKKVHLHTLSCESLFFQACTLKNISTLKKYKELLTSYRIAHWFNPCCLQRDFTERYLCKKTLNQAQGNLQALTQIHRIYCQFTKISIYSSMLTSHPLLLLLCQGFFSMTILYISLNLALDV